jgi:hypothetical protein
MIKIKEMFLYLILSISSQFGLLGKGGRMFEMYKRYMPSELF